MPKLTISNISSRYASVAALNANFQAIATAFENTVSRDGQAPNFLDNDLDVNGNNLLNVGFLNGVDVEDLSNLDGYVAQAEVAATNSAASALQASGYVVDASNFALAASNEADDAALSATNSASSALDAQGYATSAAAYSNLGLDVSGAYDLGSVADATVYFPTDFGSVA